MKSNLTYKISYPKGSDMHVNVVSVSKKGFSISQFYKNLVVKSENYYICKTFGDGTMGIGSRIAVKILGILGISVLSAVEVTRLSHLGEYHDILINSLHQGR